MSRRSPTENETVEATAKLLAQLTLSQRAEITEQRERVELLIKELKATCISHKELAEFCRVVASANSMGATEKARVPTYRRELRRAFAVLAKFPDFPARTQAALNATEALALIITLERQAYDMDAPRSARGG